MTLALWNCFWSSSVFHCSMYLFLHGIIVWLWLWLYKVVWDQIYWYLQYCCFWYGLLCDSNPLCLHVNFMIHFRRYLHAVKTYRLLLVIWLFSWYQYWQLMNVGDLSIFQCLLQFIYYLKFFTVEVFTSLVRLILSYFYFLKWLWMRFPSPISLSESSVLMYRKPTEFCILILYSILLKVFISFEKFLVEFFGFVIYRICHMQIGTIWLSCLQFSSSFIFYCSFYSHKDWAIYGIRVDEDPSMF